MKKACRSAAPVTGISQTAPACMTCNETIWLSDGIMLAAGGSQRWLSTDSMTVCYSAVYHPQSYVVVKRGGGGRCRYGARQYGVAQAIIIAAVRALLPRAPALAWRAPACNAGICNSFAIICGAHSVSARITLAHRTKGFSSAFCDVRVIQMAVVLQTIMTVPSILFSRYRLANQQQV